MIASYQDMDNCCQPTLQSDHYLDKKEMEDALRLKNNRTHIARGTKVIRNVVEIVDERSKGTRDVPASCSSTKELMRTTEVDETSRDETVSIMTRRREFEGDHGLS